MKYYLYPVVMNSLLLFYYSHLLLLIIHKPLMKELEILLITPQPQQTQNTKLLFPSANEVVNKIIFR